MVPITNSPLPITKYEARLMYGSGWASVETQDGEVVVYDTPEEAMAGAISYLDQDGEYDPDYIIKRLYVAKITIDRVYRPTKATLDAYQKVVDQDSFSQADVVAAIKNALNV